ncbi:MAG: ABC transporter ATP-binding protein [Lewinellaceae bacterium]|nr:ABC transporter ATP-binding protein [Phaeodactylibacter sp.]MCB9350898.1 ABC transporter ATP-binding protein [Lewinellaceae bacterium]
MQNPQQPMRRLFRYLDNFRGSLWFSLCSSVINKIFDLMPPFLTAWLIDSVSGNVPAWIGRWAGLSGLWPTVVFLTVLTFVIFGFESLFEWLYERGFMRLAQQVQHTLRMDAYRSLQARELAFFENQRTGNLMAMLNDDINQLERFLNHVFNEIVQLITLVLFAGWALCAVSLPLGLLGMAPIPFIIAGSLYYQKKIAPFYQSIREGVGRLGTRLENNISGILVIKSFTAEQFEAKRVEETSEQYRDANFKAINWSTVYVPLIRIFISIGFALTLLIGAYWVLFEPGRFTIGSLAFFAMMTQRLLWPVTRLGVVFDEYERARASAARIFGLIDTPGQILDPEQPRQLPEKPGRIQLQDVHFHYKAGQPVIRGLHLDVPAGQTLGVAGPTGGGKTTLIKLLLRLYDVTSGSILLEGADIRQVRVEDLRRQIALVSQDVYLFHGTIRENIAYGLNDCPMEHIIKAAKKAQLHYFIQSLPDGYESIVGERGIKLSGGQRQRLSIARAILKNAPVLILDEATSAVDTETERAIQQNLSRLAQGKTAIIIAHRLSTIRHADNIIVIKEGRIAEQGTHDELLRLNGEYADLWKVQVGEQVVER